MRRPTRGDAVLALTAVSLAVALTAWSDDGLPELLFYSVLLLVLTISGRLAVQALRLAHAEGHRADALSKIPAAAAARAAVQEERRRLGDEIVVLLRETLDSIRVESAVDLVDDRLETRLRRIHELTQRATSELRRQLGLLRTAPPPDPAPAPTRDGSRPPRRDVVLAMAMVLLAALESIAYPMVEDWAVWTPWSVVSTAMAAATVVGRSVALGPATATCAAVFAAGTLVGAPVVEGFWVLGSVAVLAWSVFSRRRPHALELLATLGLVAAVTLTRLVDSPDNLAVTIVIIVVAAALGRLVSLFRSRGAAASSRAEERARRLQEAAVVAVESERAAFARELHDVTSHAVGVIAVQAAAAEVSWRADPDAARATLEVIRTTADSALAELERWQAGDRTPRSLADIEALAERIRAAGTSVELTVVGDPVPTTLHDVHRVVQEALTNVVRHAPGARAWVSIDAASSLTTVTVRDDGPGPDQVDARGFGLVGLAERVAFAGGTLSTAPARGGHGFVVQAALPHPVDAASAP